MHNLYSSQRSGTLCTAWSRWAGRLLAGLLLMTAFASDLFGQATKPTYVLSTGFFTVNGKIYDKNGNEFVMRGVNSTNSWGDEVKNLDVLSNQIKKSKSNAVRIMTKTFYNDQSNTPAKKRDLVRRAVEAQLVPVLTTHDGTCNGTYDDANMADGALGLKQVVDHWLLPENVQLMKDYEGQLILNIANEWGPEDGYAWKEAYKTSITRLRNAGINNMLMIDPGNCGQNPIQIRDYGQELINHDPQHNVVFGLHLYAFWRTAGQTGVGAWCSGPDCPPWRYEDRIQELIDRKLPVVIGEFGYPSAEVPYETIKVMTTNQQKGIGWLAWSWQPGNTTPELDMTKAHVYNSDADLTPWGVLAITQATYGIKATAVPATIWGTSDTQAPTAPTNLASPGKTASSVS
ncbi:MAG TPA: cellulase family glycosylhydrolase, partial [Cytophagales bacterium]